MLDIGFLEQIFLDLAFASRVENFFLDLGVDGQLHADLQRDLLLLAVAGCDSNCSNSPRPCGGRLSEAQLRRVLRRP
jgi:hypothetical protein